MQTYKLAFARFYDRLWGDFADRVGPAILDYYESRAPRPLGKSMLDLCCGTGRVAGMALQRGYRVLGIDLSEGMLCQARENNAPAVEAGQACFQQGDAADFVLEKPVDLIASTFNTLNHLPDFATLECCLKCAFSALAPGGLFVFDLNTHRGLRRWHGVINVRDNEDLMLLERGLYDEDGGKAYTAITGFAQTESGLYERFEETISNTLFDLKEVRQTLVHIGWRHVHWANIRDLNAELVHPEVEEEVFFVAWK